MRETGAGRIKGCHASSCAVIEVQRAPSLVAESGGVKGVGKGQGDR